MSVSTIIQNAKAEARASLLKTVLPTGAVLGDLSKQKAAQYSAELIALAHMLNNAIPLLKDDADFIEDGSTPNPNEVDFVTEEELAERDKDIAK